MNYRIFVSIAFVERVERHWILNPFVWQGLENLVIFPGWLWRFDILFEFARVHGPEEQHVWLLEILSFRSLLNDPHELLILPWIRVNRQILVDTRSFNNPRSLPRMPSRRYVRRRIIASFLWILHRHYVNRTDLLYHLCWRLLSSLGDTSLSLISTWYGDIHLRCPAELISLLGVSPQILQELFDIKIGFRMFQIKLLFAIPIFVHFIKFILYLIDFILFALNLSFFAVQNLCQVLLVG